MLGTSQPTQQLSIQILKRYSITIDAYCAPTSHTLLLPPSSCSPPPLSPSPRLHAVSVMTVRSMLFLGRSHSHTVYSALLLMSLLSSCLSCRQEHGPQVAFHKEGVSMIASTVCSSAIETLCRSLGEGGLLVAFFLHDMI